MTINDNPYRWRASDLEAIRTALGIPVSRPAIEAINGAMAALEDSYPDGVPVARAHLDAIARLDHTPEPAAPQTDGSGRVAAALEPVIKRVTRKGAAVPIPEQLPQKKLDVIEYATELLMEEVSTEYEWPPLPEPPAPPRQRSRREHVEALLLILPALQQWRAEEQQRFSGRLIRG